MNELRLPEQLDKDARPQDHLKVGQAAHILVATAWTMRHPGGVQSHIQDLTAALTQAGCLWTFINPAELLYGKVWKAAALAKSGSVDRGRLILTQLRVRDLGKKARRVVAQKKVALLHAHDVLACQTLPSEDFPLVLTVHGPLAREVKMLMGARSPLFLAYAIEAEARAYDIADRIITVDEGQKEAMVSDYSVDPAKIRVIHNAVNTNLFTPFKPGPVRDRYLLVPRRLVKKNGVDVAIRAMKLVQDRRLSLWVVGDGPEGPALRRLARTLGLSRQVRFWGAVRERAKMAALIAGAQAVLIPSVPAEGVVEATSIAALEAMSCAVPVFASRLGGLREIIRDRETGFLFNPGNWEELGALLTEVLTRLPKEYRLGIGHAARTYVKRHHSLQVWVEKIISVYDEVIHA